MNAITYDNENNLKTSVYSIDGLQQASWSYIWGPQGLEYANKNSGALTQNFTTDPRGRILSMSYQAIGSAPQELYFHYDALGNTSLITDSNSNPKASFQYDLHTGRLINSWNPSNLEIINLNDGITGSINLTAIRAPGLGKDITIQPYPPVKIGGSTNGDNWGSIHIAPDGARMVTDLTHVSRFGKDCGDMDRMYGGPGLGDCPPDRPILMCCGVYENENGKRYYTADPKEGRWPKKIVDRKGNVWTKVDEHCECVNWL